MDQARAVLVVDDDEAISMLMRDFLEAAGFQVVAARSAREARALLDRMSIDCVLLDVMMPEENGFDLCRQLRSTSAVPILFLSAKGEDADKIRGLGIGGDDYIVKSVTPSEVVARVQAVLRRFARTTGSPNPMLTFGRLLVDLRAREVRVDEQMISLSPREFDILCLLAEHPRQVFTYEQLLGRFWGGTGDKHTVTVHISRIREKIELDPTNPQIIVNVWGVGYRFEGPRT